MFAFTPEIEYTLGSPIKIAHSALHAETRGFALAAVWNASLPPAPQPRWAALPAFRSAHVAFLTLGARGFLRVRGKVGIATPGVLCVLLNHLSISIKTAHVRFYSRKRLHPSLSQRITPTTLFLLNFAGLSYPSYPWQFFIESCKQITSHARWRGTGYGWQARIRPP